jgi:hypothetical protein
MGSAREGWARSEASDPTAGNYCVCGLVTDCLSCIALHCTALHCIAGQGRGVRGEMSLEMCWDGSVGGLPAPILGGVLGGEGDVGGWLVLRGWVCVFAACFVFCSGLVWMAG